MTAESLSEEKAERIIKECCQKIGRRDVVQRSLGEPRYILFHSPSSISSELVRVALEHTGQSYISHSVSIPTQENYAPEYVDLRKIGWCNLGKPPLTGETKSLEWTGSISVVTHGFDACALPTLVDLKAKSTIGKVIVDSKIILLYILGNNNNNKLLPPEHLQTIEKHIKLVDDFPHGAYMYDANPVSDNRPGFFKAVGPGRLHKIQIHALKDRISRIRGEDVFLKRAYKSKLTKTIMALEKSREAVSGDPTGYLKKAHEKGIYTLKELEKDLAISETGWICNTTEPTAADLAQAATMHRLLWLGMLDFMLTDLPNVRLFLDRVMTMPSLLSGAIFFPGVLPSLYLMPYVRKYKGTSGVFVHTMKYHFVNFESVIAINIKDWVYSVDYPVLMTVSGGLVSLAVLLLCLWATLSALNLL